MISTRRLLAAAALVVPGACADAPPPVAAPPPPAASAADAEHHHHERNLPPVGATVKVTVDGKSAETVLADVPHVGNAAHLLDLWRAAFPDVDPAALHFDLTGSDGFHPASRPPCARLLTGAEVAAASIDVVTHDVSFDSSVHLPGCYRVKAVVGVDGTR